MTFLKSQKRRYFKSLFLTILLVLLCISSGLNSKNISENFDSAHFDKLEYSEASFYNILKKASLYSEKINSELNSLRLEIIDNKKAYLSMSLEEKLKNLLNKIASFSYKIRDATEIYNNRINSINLTYSPKALDRFLVYNLTAHLFVLDKLFILHDKILSIHIVHDATIKGKNFFQNTILDKLSEFTKNKNLKKDMKTLYKAYLKLKKDNFLNEAFKNSPEKLHFLSKQINNSYYLKKKKYSTGIKILRVGGHAVKSLFLVPFKIIELSSYNIIRAYAKFLKILRVHWRHYYHQREEDEKKIIKLNKIKAGDILMMRDALRLSNLSIPGWWTHVGIYIGTKENLEEFELSDNEFIKQYIDKITGPTIFDSTSGGVRIIRFKDFIKYDAFAVLRPASKTWNEEQIKTLIKNASRHWGQAYDFFYNIQTKYRVSCSELVCFNYDIDFPIYRVFPFSLYVLTPSRIAAPISRSLDDESAPLKLISFYHKGNKIFSLNDEGTHHNYYKFINTIEKENRDYWVDR